MMDNEVQERFRSQIRRPVTRHACPTPDQLLASAEPGGADAVRLEVLEHVATCLECREEYEVARALLRSSSAPAARLPWQRLALAASVLLAVGLISSRQLRRTDPPVFRGDPGLLALGGAEIGDSVVAFAWHPTDGSSDYTLEVINSAGDVIFSMRTSDTTLVVPTPSLRSGPLTWSVLAQRVDGSEQRSVVRSLTLP